MIELRDIVLRYNSKEVLRSASLEINEGEALALVGSNGAGKTSLIKAISGFLHFSGNLFVDQIPVQKKDYEYKRKLGVLLNENSFFTEDISLSDHFGLINKLYGNPGEFHERVRFYCKLLELSLDDKTIIKKYSEGMKQKAQFIGAISHDPKYILLDEPFNFLDESSIESCINVLKALQREERGILLVTHNSKHIEELCDSIVLLRHGACSEKQNVNDILDSGSLKDNKYSFLSYMKNKAST